MLTDNEQSELEYTEAESDPLQPTFVIKRASNFTDGKFIGHKIQEYEDLIKCDKWHNIKK